MCLQDLEISQGIRGQLQHFTVGLTPINVAGVNSKRRSLYLGANDGSLITFSTDPAVADFVGIQVGTNQNGVLLRIEDFGVIVQAAWYAIANVAASDAWIIEGTLSRGVYNHVRDAEINRQAAD